MLGLISTLIHTTENRIEKHIIRVVSSISLGALLFLPAIGWVSTAAYLQLAQWLLPWQAAFATGGGALILGAAIMFIGFINDRRKQSHDLIHTLVGALAQAPIQSFDALGAGSMKRHQPKPVLLLH